MKQLPSLSLALVLLSSALVSADSKRTAEFLLSNPKAYQDQSVTVDVALVKPVRWVSPIPELAFFHALTIDRSDKKPGGGILVAVPSGDSAKFAKKYGTDFEGKNSSTMLKGTFLAAGGGGHAGHRGVWVIDTTGKLETLIKDRKISIPDEPSPGPAGRDRPRGPRPKPGQE
ncbi:MAG: hypothetical protein WEB60_02105 [Terrimicrobiaceae bacterium]